MPELPEVETIRLGLEPAMKGRTIRDALVRRHDLRVLVPKDFKKLVSGAKVKNTSRRGKYILIELSNSQMMVLHMGMSGRMKIIPAGAIYKNEKHDHVVLSLEGGVKIVMNDPRRFGMMYLVPAAEWMQSKPFSVMGPEPLGNEFNGPVLFESLRGLKTNIKAALLDQEIVAGVGNIYACEALFMAGISPLRIAGSLTQKESEALARAVKDVLRKAIKAGGSSLKDYRQADGGLGYFQASFSVYDRENQPCPGCDCKKKAVRRITQSGRSSFYCPSKQG